MELWDIYDADKKVTGRTMKRNDWCLKEGEYHLTVLGVIAKPDHTYLITKRVMTKAWAPGWWEVSGGAAQAGEESYEAVLREVKEETGLEIDFWDERLTTVAAERSLIEGDVSRKKRKKVIDMLAAVIILQGYLDSKSKF